MRIDAVDPDEIDDPARRHRRYWVIGAVVAVAAVAVATTVWQLNRPGSDDQAAPVASEATVPPTDPTVAFEPPVAGPGDFLDWGSDYQGAPLDEIARRTTPDGIELRLQKVDANQAGGGPFIEGDGPARQPHQPDTATVPPSGTQGWVAPGWCAPTGGFRLTMRRDTSIGTTQGSWYGEVREPLMASMHSSGFAEGHPFRVLVVQVAPDITRVAVRFQDGAVDQADVVGGVALLATMGKPLGRFSLTATSSTGPREIRSTDIGREGDQGWQAACTAPPPQLPAAGVQPSDPAAAEQQVREQFGVMVAVLKGAQALPDDLLTDSTGVQAGLDGLDDSGMRQIVQQVTFTLDGLVFTAPTQAWLRYHTSFGEGGSVLGTSFGIAELVDGTWLLDRRTICGALGPSLQQCDPAAEPIQPPAG